MHNLMNIIHNIDCLKFMKQIPDKYFDLCLSDPPYGIGNNITYRKNNCSKVAKSKDYGAYTWNDKKPEKSIFDEIFRISKNQIIFGANHFIEAMPKNSSCWLVWDKDNASSTFADCELAWTSFKTAVRKYTYTWNGMIQADMKNKEVRVHPTQKPIKLFTAILQDYAKEGHKIFDPFMGSGTTALACEALGLEWCGCELEEQYVDAANERLKTIQPDIFGVSNGK